MLRKILVVGLVLAAFLLILAVVGAPTRAAARSEASQQPVPQNSQVPDALPVFQAVLSGKEEVPSVVTPATGRAVMVLDDDLTTLHYRLMVSNIANITAAHIHFGPLGQNGDIIFPLFTGSGVFGPGDPISGTLTLSPVQVTELIVGNYYVNVHTNIHPAGEIRGQLNLFTPSSQFNALLTGAEETPPVTTPATGAASFTLNASMDQLSYRIDVSNIISITAAHLHPGWPGQAGPPVVNLYTGGTVFDPSNPLTGTAPITSRDLLDLLTGYLYVNVHTTAYPAGEIRGQVGSGYFAFEADLSGQNEVPPVTTTATGRAVMVLDSNLNTLLYRVSVSDLISPTAAHIHIGAPGQNGPIVFPLYAGSGPFDENHPISGTITFTGTEEVNHLLAGDYYVNVHTSANPGGEIRGQLARFTPASRYTARLSGAEEVPPVATPATGTAEFVLSDPLNSLEYHVRVLSISNITLAHLHTGFPGQVGPPVVPLYSAPGDFDPHHPLHGTTAINAQNLLDLLTGYLYVNVHTQAYPGGEIRGQLNAVDQWILYFPLIFKP